MKNINKSFIKGIYCGFCIALFFVTITQLFYYIRETDLIKINNIMYLVKENYIESFEKNDILDGMYKGIFHNLDSYSSYMSAEEYNSFISIEDNNFCGVGIRWQKNEDGYCEIIRVFEDGPAYNSGLQKGDLIISINNKNIGVMSREEIKTELRGLEGTEMCVKVIRDNVEFDYTFVREPIQIPFVLCDIEDNIGIITIDSFEGTVVEDFRQALLKIDKNNIKDIVIDLRNNTGGNVDCLGGVLEELLDKEYLVFTLKNKDNISNDYIIKGTNKHTYNIVVLVNKYSASCSEIMAGMLRDYGLATVLGETTYGKGVVQESFVLEDNSVVFITTGRYYLPNGSTITKDGLIPTVEIEDISSTDKDEQLEKAKELLKDGDI